MDTQQMAMNQNTEDRNLKREVVIDELLRLWQEVLQREVGLDDEFIQSGGNSLRAIELECKINKELNVDISIERLFESITIRELAEYVLDAEELSGSEEIAYMTIEKVEDKPYYVASSAQKRIFTLSYLGNGSTNYNMPSVRVIKGNLNTDKFREVFQNIINRHETLRTSFQIIDGDVVQIIKQDVMFEIPYINATTEDVPMIIEDFIRPFDLSEGPLVRGSLIEVTNQEWVFLFDMHHIISDGLSMNILWKEIVALYMEEELPPLKIQYKDFSTWQNKLLESDKIKKQEFYWLERFSGEIPKLNLPTDYSRPLIQNYEGDYVEFKCNRELGDGIRALMIETGSTLYMVLLSIFNILLSKYSGQQDIIVGSPIAGRRHAELENIIGMFVNTLAMRNYPEGNKSFREFLLEVRENALRGYENQDYQFEELVDKLHISRDISRNPLFDVMFTLQNFQEGTTEIRDLQFDDYHDSDNILSKFDMTLFASDAGRDIDFRIEYCSKLFTKETIKRMAEHFNRIIEQVVDNGDILLREINILNDKEKDKLLKEFNKTTKDYPHDQTIQQLFEERVKLHPNQIAVMFKEKAMTYRELNEASNHVAFNLREKGVKPDTIVGIMVDRSLEMMVGILGIIKAGGAYCPIDPENPSKRVEYILEDSGIQILLSTGNINGPENFNGETMLLDDEDLYRGDYGNLQLVNQPTDLAYVIYTSGSTGMPKGAMIQHSSVINLVTGLQGAIYKNYSQPLNVALVAPYVFDASVQQIFASIILGNTLNIVPSEVRKNGSELIKYYQNNNIHVSDGTPVLINIITQVEENMELPVKHFIIGGEALSKEIVNNFYKKVENYPKITNVYGVTECTVDSTSLQIDGPIEGHGISIGKPMANIKIYILNQDGNIVPTGVIGEICIGGLGLARSYINRQELTTEKFIENPYGEGKIYKTGDLGRWLPDGNIEFLGRMDHQVKIRGYRVELGEIENKLLGNPNITKAVVLVKEQLDKSKYLCGYIVAEKEMTLMELRQYLSNELPEYMIPSYFKQLKEIPLTVNGKVDNKALMEMGGLIDSGVPHEEPQNPTEERLVEIWKGLLGLDRVGIRDNFFEVGGHSLKAIVLSSKVKREWNVDLGIVSIFQNPTIKELATIIQNTKNHQNVILDENVVLLKSIENSKYNLFLLHDGTGEVGGYVEFTNYLNSEFSVYGLQVSELHKKYPQHIGIEELANMYLDKIKRIQPNGPYYIGGWSTGGTIAYELVRRLEELKNDVGILLLFDAHIVNSNNTSMHELDFTLENERKLLKSFIREETSDKEIKNATSLEKLWEVAINIISQSPIEELKKIIEPNILKAITESGNKDARYLVYLMNTMRSIQRARELYAPNGKISANIYFFQPTGEESSNPNIWAPFASKEIKVIKALGDHYSMFKSLNAKKLAEEVDIILKQTH